MIEAKLWLLLKTRNNMDFITSIALSGLSIVGIMYEVRRRYFVK